MSRVAHYSIAYITCLFSAVLILGGAIITTIPVTHTNATAGVAVKIVSNDTK